MPLEKIVLATDLNSQRLPAFDVPKELPGEREDSIEGRRAITKMRRDFRSEFHHIQSVPRRSVS
jgi:hypothetical protein